MKKAIVSAAGPNFSDIMACSEPTFQRYAEEHDYELIIEQLDKDSTDFFHEDARNARMGKLALIKTALEDNDFVVWMDADTMFTNFDKDIAQDVKKEWFQAFVWEQSERRYRVGINPNTGVWPIRQEEESFAFIESAQGVGQLEDIKGTDQEAVCTSLGLRIEKTEDSYTIRPAVPSPFLNRTGVLPYEWNQLGLAKRWPARVLHFAGMKNEKRLPLMRQTLEELEKQGKLTLS